MVVQTICIFSIYVRRQYPEVSVLSHESDERSSASRKRSPSSRRRWSSCTGTAWSRCRRSRPRPTTCCRSARRGAVFRRTRTVAWGEAAGWHDKRGPLPAGAMAPATAPVPAPAAGLGGRAGAGGAGAVC